MEYYTSDDEEEWVIFDYKNITAIIDLEGHLLPGRGEKRYMIREMALVGMNWEQPSSALFDLRPLLKDLSNMDHKTITWVKYNYSGLPEIPSPGEKTYPSYQVCDLLKRWYLVASQSKKSPNDIVAYKGNWVAQQILNDCKIPSVDIEKFGCQKYDAIPNKLYFYNNYQCGHHVCDKKKRLHCCSAKVMYYQQWIKGMTFSYLDKGVVA